MILGFNDVRKGTIVVLDDEPYQVMSAEFLRKQQRRPVVRAMLKHLRTGQTREHTFMQSDKVLAADINRKVYQYLYGKDGVYTFMDQQTFDQVEYGNEIVGDTAKFLLEGQEVTVLMFADKPVTVELPIKITRLVTEAAPGVRGDTAGNVLKEATVEGGVKVRVPLFIREGDKIIVDTRTGTYVERA